MAHRSNKNNLAAGLFLISSLAVALAISFWLGGFSDRLGSKAEYTVRFPMEVGVTGLQPGSKVTLAGLEIGRVHSVHRQVLENRVLAMEASIQIDSEVQLYEDATAFLVMPILGGVSAINIGSVGIQGSPLREGASIAGGITPGLLAQMGFGSTEADQIRAIIANFEETSAQARDLIEELDQIASAFASGSQDSATDLRGVLADARNFTSRFTGDNGWDSRIDSILQDGQKGASRIPEITDTLDQAVTGADLFIEESRGFLAENRPGVRRVLSDTEALVSRVRFETAIRFEELLDQGVLTAASYGEIGDRFNLMLTREYPEIRRTISNARETSDQLKLAIGELRSQPWRLLKSPSGAELEKEPLYAAARAYAVAVSDLRAASEALENAVGNAEARGTDATTNGAGEFPEALELAGMAREVEAAFGRYQTAEESLLELLASK